MSRAIDARVVCESRRSPSRRLLSSGWARPVASPRHGVHLRRTTPCRRKASPWTGFVRRHRKEGTLRDLSRLWQAMTDDEKARYNPRRPRSAHAASSSESTPLAAPSATGGPWPHLGDDFYPLRAELAASIADKIADTSVAWRRRTGDGVIKAEASIGTSRVPLCSEMLGRGCCGRVLADGRNEALLDAKGRLHLWAVAGKTKDVKFDALWSRLPLWYIGPAPDAAPAASGSDDDLRGGLLLLIFSELNPSRQMWFSGRVQAPTPGQTVSFGHAAHDNILCEVEVARARVRVHVWVWWCFVRGSGLAHPRSSLGGERFGIQAHVTITSQHHGPQLVAPRGNLTFRLNRARESNNRQAPRAQLSLVSS